MLRSSYEQVPANHRGHYPIESMANLLLTGWENTQGLVALVKRLGR